jgi:1,4-alpha-glucan branching enzyme
MMLYQISHPGAKLNFMGSEFGQFIEWRFYEQLEWFLLDYESHRLLQSFNAELNRFYIEHPQLWIDDHTWAGFEWIDASDTKNNVFIYKRSSPKPEENDIYVALNMVPQPLENYDMPVYELGTYKILFNTDDMSHGGSGYPTGTDANGCFEAIDEPLNGKPYRVTVNLPPLAGIYFMKVKDPVKKKPAVKKTAAKKPEAKKAPAKKTPAKKAVKAEPEKAAVKKTPAKKPAAKKTTKANKTK